MSTTLAEDDSAVRLGATAQVNETRKRGQSNAALLEDLRTIEAISCFDVGPDSGPDSVCQLLFANIGRAVGATSLGMFLKEEDASQFNLHAAMPDENRDAILAEFMAQAKQGQIDKAMAGGRLVGVPILVAQPECPAAGVILCPISTPRRTWGIVLAFSPRTCDELSEEMTILPNIIAAQAARMMETSHLARRVAELEEHVEEIVQTRHERILTQRQEDAVVIESLQQESAGRSELLSLLGHELRTPLTSIISLAEFLMEEPAKDDRTNEFTVAIHSEAERMHRLLTDVMDLAKMEAGKLTYSFMENDLNDLVELCIASLNGNALKRNITIRFEKDDSLPLFEFAPDRLQQAIVNMLSNAVKFSNDNSDIILATRNEGEQVFFSVQDFGEGIAARDIPKVFNKFEQIERAGPAQKGFGFGMPLAKRIIEDGHGGKMWLRSEGRGHGTTFFFTLPRQARARPAN